MTLTFGITKLVIIFIVGTPIAAIGDWLLLKPSYEKRTGKKMDWTTFFIPCFLETGCFLLGVMVGSVL